MFINLSITTEERQDVTIINAKVGGYRGCWTETHPMVLVVSS